MEKIRLKLIFVTESTDRDCTHDIGEAGTMEGVEAFISDLAVIKMRVSAGIDVESQEVLSALGDFKIF